jgi:hypothetical protein
MTGLSGRATAVHRVGLGGIALDRVAATGWDAWPRDILGVARNQADYRVGPILGPPQAPHWGCPGDRRADVRAGRPV